MNAPLRLRQRMPRYESRRLLDVARLAPRCFIVFPGYCTNTRNPTVPAHSNLQRHGRGKDYKSHDPFAIAGCNECHYELDHGKRFDRATKEAHFERAGPLYRAWLLGSGHVIVTDDTFNAAEEAFGARFLTLDLCQNDELWLWAWMNDHLRVNR